MVVMEEAARFGSQAEVPKAGAGGEHPINAPVAVAQEGMAKSEELKLWLLLRSGGSP